MRKTSIFLHIFTVFISVSIALSLALTLSSCGFIERLEIANPLSSLLDFFGYTPSIYSGLSGLTDYSVKAEDIKTGTLILADDDHPYDVNESILDLIEGCKSYRNAKLEAEGIDTSNTANLPYVVYGGMRLSNSAMDAAHDMLSDAKAAVGQKPICIDGTYGMVVHGGYNVAEFNTGHLMYLSDYASEANAHVALSKEYREWLDANAYKYGFIESFEDGYRYVGVPHAKLIHDNSGISNLADYIAFLKENTGYDKTVRVKVDGVEYAIYYAACNEGDAIKAPKDLANTTISGTNEGGVIITVRLN